MPNFVLEGHLERADSAANWAAKNPVLLRDAAFGTEIGFETDTGSFKIGDGITPWNSLPYGSVKHTNLLAANFSNIRIASQFPGADWGAKVNAADADLGAQPGRIWLDQSAGTSPPAADVLLSRNHVLEIIQPGTNQGGLVGTYSLGSHSFLVNTGSGIVSPFAEQTETNKSGCLFLYTGTGSAIKPADTTGITYNVKLKGFQLYGPNGTASTIGIDHFNASAWCIEDVSVLVFNGAGATGIRLYNNILGGYYSKLNRVFVGNTNTAILFDSDTFNNGPNAHSLLDVRIDIATNGINMNHGGSIRGHRVLLNGISGTGIRFNDALSIFDACRMENPAPGTSIGLDFTNVSTNLGKYNRYSGTVDNFNAVFSPTGIIDNYARIDSVANGFSAFGVQQLPKMTTAEKNALIATEGLVVYDTTLHKICVRGAAGWETVTSA